MIQLSKYFFLISLALGLLSACQPKKELASFTPQLLILDSLTALDLSEDLTQISSGNDELLMFIHQFEKRGEELVFEVSSRLAQMDFLLGESRALSYKTPWKKNTVWVLSLIELDGADLEDVSLENFSKWVEEGKYGIAWKGKLNELLLYDDLLGQIVISASAAQPGTRKQTLSGREFFETFSYELSYHFK